MGRTTRVAHGIVFYLATIGLAGIVSAQETAPNAALSTALSGGPQDWSNRHVIFTRNGSPQEMWKLRNDPRFVGSMLSRYMNELRGHAALAAAARPADASLDETGLENDSYSKEGSDDIERFRPLTPWNPIEFRVDPYANDKHSKVDWSVSLGPTGGTSIGESPAIYTANYSSPSCANDFAVYTINATPGVGTQANLVALNNLYSTGAGTGYCAGTGPIYMFSYAIGNGGSALSPVLSLDGTRVAWIENRSATTSYLHVTIWVASQGGSATSPVAVTGTFSNGACTPAGSSCDIAIQYTNATYPPGCPTAYSAGNTHSDLYVDYGSDSGFISANNGLLYHIKNIFSTTASPTVDFCIPVNTSFETTPSGAMSGPVYDSPLGEVFVTDSEKIYAYKVNPTLTTPNFTLAASYQFGNTGSNYNYPTGPGPLVDAFNGYVYVFSTYDANGNTSVTQMPVSLASGTAVTLGPKNTNANPILFYGAFDNNYFNNGPKSSASTLYSCGTDSTTTTAQDLFSISFNASTGIVNTTPAMSYNTNVNPGGNNGLCSPITEFYDGTTDRIFVGEGQSKATSGANAVTMWKVNTQLTNTSGTGGTMPTYSAIATGYAGGSSGISADNNDSAKSQAESIYFSTEQVGGTSTTVPATTAYNVNGIYNNGVNFPCGGGLDNDGNAYSETLLGTTVTWNGTTFNLGPSNIVDAWSNTTITLPSGQFSTLTILAAAVNVTSSGTTQSFTVNYTDGSSTTLTQSFSDWFNPLGFNGESIAKSMAYRNTCNGGEGAGPFDVYGYSFAINPNKTVKTLTLPATRNVVFLAAALSTGCGGADYCAVKLTQSALQ